MNSALRKCRDGRQAGSATEESEWEVKQNSPNIKGLLLQLQQSTKPVLFLHSNQGRCSQCVPGNTVPVITTPRRKTEKREEKKRRKKIITLGKSLTLQTVENCVCPHQILTLFLFFIFDLFRTVRVSISYNYYPQKKINIVINFMSRKCENMEIEM